jgi:hypothetical protein
MLKVGLTGDAGSCARLAAEWSDVPGVELVGLAAMSDVGRQELAVMFPRLPVFALPEHLVMVTGATVIEVAGGGEELLRSVIGRAPVVVCAAPLGIDGGSARRIVAAASEARSMLVMRTALRHHPGLARVRQALDLRQAGQPVFARLRHWHDGATELDARRTIYEAGDLFASLFGPVRSVQCDLVSVPSATDGGDRTLGGLLTFCHASDMRCLLEFGLGPGARPESGSSFTLSGTAGVLDLRDIGMAAATGGDAGGQGFCASLAPALESGAIPATLATEQVWLADLADLAFRSSALGRRLDIAPLPDAPPALDSRRRPRAPRRMSTPAPPAARLRP